MEAPPHHGVHLRRGDELIRTRSVGTNFTVSPREKHARKEGTATRRLGTTPPRCRKAGGCEVGDGEEGGAQRNRRELL